VNVIDNRGQNRYELRDGDEVVGFTEYHFYGTELALLHTEIRPESGGRGLGSELIKGVLDDARSRDLKVLPYCQFVRAYIGKHTGYLDLVPDTHRGMFDL
jgi:predicted GNAT family acetyltransferase